MGKLKKVQLAGGRRSRLCDAPAGRGGTWNRDNVIVFTPSTSGELQRVSSAGGAPVTVSALDTTYGETNHRWPAFCPTAATSCLRAPSAPAVRHPNPHASGSARSIPKDTATLLQVESSSALASGHLLFIREGTLMAQPFDPSVQRLTADAFPVAETVGGEGSRYGSFSVSDNGTLLYARGVISTSSRLIWF